MECQDSATPPSSGREPARRPYTTPRLVVHGPIQDVTRVAPDGQASIMPDN